MNIITGEKIQQICDIYLRIDDDFNYNPIIKQQTQKHVDLRQINESFNNPYYVFCYSHRIDVLSEKIHLFQNNFILISGNSDGEIRECKEVFTILNSNKLVKWVSQNICFEHEKLRFCPIGLANSMWPHGNLSVFENLYINNIPNVKTQKIYFNFAIGTNRTKRELCYDSLKNKLTWLNNVSPIENNVRLKEYEFCICPEGNGVDTHRLWEALYLKVVPIVVKSEFTTILQKNNIPLVILHDWNDLDTSQLNYSDFDFTRFEKDFHFEQFITSFSL